MCSRLRTMMLPGVFTARVDLPILSGIDGQWETGLRSTPSRHSPGHPGVRCRRKASVSQDKTRGRRRREERERPEFRAERVCARSLREACAVAK